MKVSEFKTGRFYIDTNFFHHFLRPDPKYKPLTDRLFQRIEDGEVRAFTTVLVFDELAYRLLLALVKDKYDGNPLGLLRAKHQHMLTEFYPTVAKTIGKVKSIPHLEILDITGTDINGMLKNMSKFLLMPRDALHISVMKRNRLKYIASDDRSFDCVEDIERIWLYNPHKACG